MSMFHIMMRSMSSISAMFDKKAAELQNKLDEQTESSVDFEGGVDEDADVQVSNDSDKSAELIGIRSALKEMLKKIEEFLKDVDKPTSDTAAGASPESFDAVWKEFDNYMKDFPNESTKTIEEKNTVLGYIDRILNSDAPEDVKQYWATKAKIIKSEIVRIKNNESKTVENFDELWKEIEANMPEQAKSEVDLELSLEYTNRILESNAPADVKQYWQMKAQEFKYSLALIGEGRLNNS